MRQGRLVGKLLVLQGEIIVVGRRGTERSVEAIHIAWPNTSLRAHSVHIHHVLTVDTHFQLSTAEWLPNVLAIINSFDKILVIRRWRVILPLSICAADILLIQAQL